MFSKKKLVLGLLFEGHVILLLPQSQSHSKEILFLVFLHIFL